MLCLLYIYISNFKAISLLIVDILGGGVVFSKSFVEDIQRLYVKSPTSNENPI